MATHGKKYRQAASSIDRTKMYTLDEGINLSLKSKFAKFDEAFDIAVRLGVDPRHADQMIRSTIVLPNGLGKEVRIAVFATGDKEKEALEAGANFAGGKDLVEKIQGGWLEFDKTIATPDMMGEVGKIGRVLGPRGLMPNAKLGTVTFDVGRVVREMKAGKVDFKVDKAGVVHAMVGRASFAPEKLKENIVAFLDKIISLKPSTAKGVYLRGVSLSTTMGIGVKIDPLDIRTLVKNA
ncbi:MAG: 50S ribosomal protein L1 [Thermodesulfobacteriota bacterium]